MTAVVFLALLALQQPAPKVQTRPLPEPQRASPYEVLVSRYLHGEYDSSVEETTRRAAKAFEKPFEDAYAKVVYRAREERLRNGRQTSAKASLQAQDDLVRFLLAVMMLHTEAALRTPSEEMEGQLRLARTADRALGDAEHDLETHQPGSGFLQKADVDRARHDWVVLVALGYHARSMLDSLRQYLVIALQRYPQDPPLELCLGVYYERAARYSVVDESLARDIYPSQRVADWRHALEQAVSAYGEAAKAPDLAHEARLRTGRVRAQLDDEKRARAELEPLVGAEPAFVSYLALLFLGNIDEAAGQAEVAESRYRAALAAFPTAHAPMVALSRLRDAAGDTAGARDWMEKSFALTHERRVDPWWWYGVPLVDVSKLAVSLRAQIRP